MGGRERRGEREGGREGEGGAPRDSTLVDGGREGGREMKG